MRLFCRIRVFRFHRCHAACLDFLASVGFAVLGCCGFDVFGGFKTSCLTVLIRIRVPFFARNPVLHQAAAKRLRAAGDFGHQPSPRPGSQETGRNSGSCPPRTSSRPCRHLGSRDPGAEPARQRFLAFSFSGGLRMRPP